MIFLHHKGAVDGEGEGGDGGEDGEIEGEQEGGEDLTIGSILLAPTLLKILIKCCYKQPVQGLQGSLKPSPKRVCTQAPRAAQWKEVG